jgi:hypothetical protein
LTRVFAFLANRFGFLELALSGVARLASTQQLAAWEKQRRRVTDLLAVFSLGDESNTFFFSI